MRRALIGLGFTLAACGGGGDDTARLEAPTLTGKDSAALSSEIAAYEGYSAEPTVTLPSGTATYRGYLVLTQSRPGTATLEIAGERIETEVPAYYTAAGEAALTVDFTNNRIAGQAGGFQAGLVELSRDPLAGVAPVAGQVDLSAEGFDGASVLLTASGDITLDGVSQGLDTTLDGTFYGAGAEALGAEGDAILATSGGFDVFLGALAE